MSSFKRARLVRLRPSVLKVSIAVFLFALCSAAFAAEKPRIQVNDYVIDADLAPKTHHLTAKAKVKFTALDDISTAVFELHNGLRVTRVTNEAGKVLPTERVTQDFSVRVSLPEGMSKGQTQTLNFEYEGVLNNGEDSPVEGLKLASINPDTSYLLYASRWFPMVGYETNRFTATINVTVPAFFQVIGSGAKPGASHPGTAGNKTVTFVWDTPSFPGTIIAGPFVETDASNLKIYFKPNHKEFAQAYADTAAREIAFFSQ